MTNPCVVISFTDHKKYVLDEEATEARKNRNSITDEEIQSMLKKADKIENKYFKLRAKAIVALAKIFGNRRNEIASLKITDLKIEGSELVVTFTLSKKRKRGLFQYTKFLESKIKKGEMLHSELESKTQKQLSDEWEKWQLTKEGVHVKVIKSLKSEELTSPFVQIIIEYWEYVKNNFPNAKFLFPTGKAIYSKYMVNNEEHLQGQSLLLIVKDLNPDLWLHLFRELKGGEVAKAFGRTIQSVYEVKDTLDLEKEETAWGYVKRSVPKKMSQK
jgi:hypothetical protein